MCIKPTGEYIAFAAGTGVLCFIDLVALIAMTKLEVVDEVDPTDERIDINKFKLTMYVSFHSNLDGIGDKLLLALQNHCKRTKSENFKLHLRLTSEGINDVKWDEKFIEQ